MTFKPVDQKVDFVELERKWLVRWEEQNIVKKYLQKNSKSDKRFSFIDGPITANNPMGVHHAWGRTYKDLWQKFKNMQGFKQRFQNGFDNQGLWVEVEVEKKLGFKSKKDIENYGIEKFVEDCKESTQNWSKVQTEQSKKLGYFMDWENSYYTMSNENNYTIWYFLKNCYEKGLIYKGRDAVPWCPRCGTAISQHEILQEEYKELTHNSIFFELPVEGKKGEFFLVWTTTPWTLPANVALAVNPELEYFLVTGTTGENFWVVGSLASSLFGGNLNVVKKVKGSELIGFKYSAPFDNLPAVRQARNQNEKTFHSVVTSEELVVATEGSGIVHIATGCGTEDFALGKEKGLPVLPAIDEAANYLDGFGEFTGKNAKNDPNLILKSEELKDFIFEIKPFTHRYPTCWRCKTELVWRVVDEWYIKMDPVRDSLKKSAEKASWIPDWALDREIDWLNNMDDWMISKKRYWGLALPIWECQCGNFDIIGSEEELKEKAVEGFDSFSGHSPHRPWIDAVKIKCSKCGKISSRIKDVGNPWLDAGIVPFSTLIDSGSKKVSYLGDKSYWRQWFPADFVTECFPGQFKNWFYSILTMSTVLENCPPFKTLLGHGLVRDEKGEEMHKSKGNTIWFDEAVGKMGADVMRWMYLTQNPVQNLNFGYNIADETRRRFHLLLWNIYNFFVTYSNLDKIERSTLKFFNVSENVLDRWAISRLNNLIKTVTDNLEKYDAYSASLEIEKFVGDFSTWFVRRSRNRKDKIDCYRTFYIVLVSLAKLLAPFIPFLSEEIFKNLTEEESVHLQDWPSFDQSLIDEKLEKMMETVRKVCELGHAKRKEEGIKVRQPLAEFEIRNLKFEISEDLLELIKGELNVKKIKFIKGKGETEVSFDTQITPELKEEGWARDLIRQIQEARKNAGCGLSERIKIGLPSWPKNFEEEIKNKTFSLEIIKNKEVKIIRNV